MLLSDEELAQLRALAGGVPLSTFVRALLLGLKRQPDAVVPRERPSDRPRVSDLHIVVSETEIAHVRALARNTPISRFVREVLNGAAADPQAVVRLMHGAPTQPIAPG